tara:strand:- start:167 stop:502 length:336 start_codon:yes stop_codon:yes gene_type:complete
MNSILSITDQAEEQIKKILNSAPDGQDALLVGVDKSGCSGYSYKLDFIYSKNAENYDLIKKNGVKVYIDPKAIMFLIGSQMDFQTDKLSSRFVFKNPNEKSTCGCGESFNI